LLETSLILARKLAQRIELDTTQGLIKYTIRIGLAEFSSKDESFNTTFNHADKAMYSGKTLGQNRVEQYETEQT